MKPTALYLLRAVCSVPSLLGPVLAQTAPLQPDLPGLNANAHTVGSGTLQLEAGLPTVTSAQVRTTSVPVLLRAGMADWAELRLEASYNSLDSDEIRGRRGFGDLKAGPKLRTLSGTGARPTIALMPAVAFPLGPRAFRASSDSRLTLGSTLASECHLA